MFPLSFYSIIIVLCANAKTSKVDLTRNLAAVAFVESDEVFKAQVGGAGYLSCSILNMNNLTLAWLRVRDSHILTIEDETFISDAR